MANNKSTNKNLNKIIDSLNEEIIDDSEFILFGTNNLIESSITKMSEKISHDVIKDTENNLDQDKITEAIRSKVNTMLDDNDILFERYRTKITVTSFLLEKILLDLNNAPAIHKDVNEITNNIYEHSQNNNLSMSIINLLDTTNMQKIFSSFFFRQEKLKLLKTYKEHEKIANKISKLNKEIEQNTSSYHLEKEKLIQSLKNNKSDKNLTADDIKNREETLLQKIEELENTFKENLMHIKDKIYKLKPLEKSEKVNRKKVLKDITLKQKEYDKAIEEINSREEKILHRHALVEKNDELSKDQKKIRKVFYTKAKFMLPKKSISQKCDALFSTTNMDNSNISTMISSSSKHKHDQLLKSLKYLKAYGLIQYFPLEDQYKLILDKWINSQQHPLIDKQLSNELIPLLLSYLKFKATNRVDGFLAHIDKISDFLLQDPKKTSTQNLNEETIIKALKDNKKLTITTDTTTFTNVKALELFYSENHEKVLYLESKHTFKEPLTSLFKIYPMIDDNDTYSTDKNKKLKKLIDQKKAFLIHIDENDEYSKYENVIIDKMEASAKSNIILTWTVNKHEIKIDNIKEIKLAIKKSYGNQQEKEEDFTDISSKFSIHQEEYNIPDRKPYNIILEADINLIDFFNIKPLKNQVIYKTKSEKEEFCKDHNIEVPAKSKIYITAQDQTDAVIHVVKRCIPSVKILEPSAIKNKFRDIIKSMCDEM